MVLAGETFATYGIDLPPGASGEVDVLCPQCSHTRKKSRDKCLSVNVDLGTWYCQHTHCGWSGGLKEYATGIQRIQRQPIYEPPRALPGVVAPTLWEKAVTWFAERAISETTLQHAGVAASNEFCPGCDGEVGNILFPYYRGGQHINTKHRCGKKHFRMERGAERVFYGLDSLVESTIVVVEGEVDKLSLDEAGIPSGLSVPDGAPAPDAKSYASKFSFLESAEDVFTAATKVILATDADAPGQKLADELARRIGPEKCWRVNWQECGVKDANECLVKFGPELLALAVEAAEPYPVEGIFTGRDLRSELMLRKRNGLDQGILFGPPQLRNHFRVRPGQLVIFTGIPSHGKSSVVDQLLLWLIADHGCPVTMFSPEQQPLWMHQRNLIEMKVGKPFWGNEAMTDDEAMAANDWLADRVSFILPEMPSVEAILELARVEVYRKGAQVVVIDPYNEVEHARPRHMSETEYISSTLSTFRRFAINSGVSVWFVAHPTKMPQLGPNEPEPIPNLWNVSGSAHWRNKADVGATVYRDIHGTTNEVDLIINKMRWLDTGKTGRIRFQYDPLCKRLAEVGIVDQG